MIGNSISTRVITWVSSTQRLPPTQQDWEQPPALLQPGQALLSFMLQFNPTPDSRAILHPMEEAAPEPAVLLGIS